MSLKRRLSAIALALPVIAVLSSPAEAHRRWLLPSATVLAGEEEVVSVDAASSNQLFIFEHRPLGLEDLSVTGPDGQAVAATVIGTGAYRSVFDVPLKKQGTYRIALVSNGVMGFYEMNGERQRWRGTEEELATAIPAGASDVRISRNSSRTETFATLGAPNDVALQPTGAGLEMIPVSHPNDLVVGEPARFRFLIDGEPAANMEIEWVPGGTRYRDEAASEKLTTNADGVVEVTADQPGMHYLEAGQSEDLPDGGQIGSRRSSYTAVLEFLPL